MCTILAYLGKFCSILPDVSAYFISHHSCYVISLLNCEAFSIKWPEEDVGEKLLQHLRSIPLKRIAEMKNRLEEAACFFDFHRGYGSYGHGKKEWIQWSQNQVALGGDCPYVGHGDGETLEACHSSCKQSSCNLVNFHDGDCVLRQCRDPAQPALTGGAAGWQVWSMINETQLQCSPYHAIFKTLKQRHKNRPFTHG